jgi:hypothetical protein
MTKLLLTTAAVLVVASTTAYADPCGSFDNFDQRFGFLSAHETALTYMCYGSFSSKPPHSSSAWPEPERVRSSELSEKPKHSMRAKGPLLLTYRATHQLSCHRRTRYSQLAGPTRPGAVPLPISDVPLPRPRPTNLGVPAAATASAPTPAVVIK